MTNLAQHFLLLFTKEKGIEELLEKLSHPLWFQSLGCYLWFDWHSSGLTTVVGGVLSQALKNINYEIWIYIAGWKGKTALSTPQKIEELAYKFSLTQYKRYIQASKLLAKTDNSLIQDGYSLYYHQIFFDSNGNYTVIQQGLNIDWKPTARRYHWHSSIWNKVLLLLQWKTQGLTKEEFNIISAWKKSKVLNLLSLQSSSIRQNIVEIIKYIQTHYKMPEHHLITTKDFDIKRFIQTLTKIRHNLDNFKDLLQIPGLGPKAIFNLVQAAELIYWNQADWSDPARFSFTHWGKDGTPYKPRPEEFDQSIAHLRILIDQARKRANMKKIYFNTKQPSLFSELGNKNS